MPLFRYASKRTTTILLDPELELDQRTRESFKRIRDGLDDQREAVERELGLKHPLTIRVLEIFADAIATPPEPELWTSPPPPVDDAAFRLGEGLEPHIPGDKACRACWDGPPKPCSCGGLIHFDKTETPGPDHELFDVEKCDRCGKTNDGDDDDGSPPPAVDPSPTPRAR